MAESGKRKPLLGGYLAALQDREGRERYCNKLSVTGGVDPYEVPSNEWMDDVDLWPAISYIHVGMYVSSANSQSIYK